MVYQDKKKTYFIDSFGRDYTYYGFRFKRIVCQVSRKLQCLDSKLCGAYFVFFACTSARGLDMDSIMDYFTWDWRFINEFIYNYIKEIRDDPVQRRVRLRLHQGKTINNENNTGRFRNVEQFTRCVRSIQSNINDTYENGSFSSGNWCARNNIRIDWTWKQTLNKVIRNTIQMVYHVSITCIVSWCVWKNLFENQKRTWLCFSLQKLYTYWILSSPLFGHLTGLLSFCFIWEKYWKNDYQ